jgi:hypothetical protein
MNRASRRWWKDVAEMPAARFAMTAAIVGALACFAEPSIGGLPL